MLDSKRRLNKWARFVAPALGLMVAGIMAAPAGALTLQFEAITTNTTDGGGLTEPEFLALQSQLRVEVEEEGTPVSFQFFNDVGLQSSITDIYFEDVDGVFDWTSANITNSGGVAFSAGATPGDLPSGDLTTAYSLDSDSPGLVDNGVNALGEWVMVAGDYAGAHTSDDLVIALLDGTFRIGMHVQSLGANGEFSDGFVNLIPTVDDPRDPQDPQNPPIPEPATLGLIGMGVVALGLRNRRKNLT